MERFVLEFKDVVSRFGSLLYTTVTWLKRMCIVRARYDILDFLIANQNDNAGEQPSSQGSGLLRRRKTIVIAEHHNTVHYIQPRDIEAQHNFEALLNSTKLAEFIQAAGKFATCTK